MHRLSMFVVLVHEFQDGLADLIDFGSRGKPPVLGGEEADATHDQIIDALDTLSLFKEQSADLILYRRNDLFASFVQCHGQCLLVGLEMP
ncbi:protein of unknown function [Hyphomicrobium sp. MC1]|nr:protein of unknown function [Hyphomicrobium sp. MC1]